MSDSQCPVCDLPASADRAGPGAVPPDRGAAQPDVGDPIRARRRAWLVACFGPAVLLPCWLVPWDALGWRLPLTFSGLLAVGLTLAATVMDIRFRKIPNWATYSALAWAVLLNAAHSLAGASGMAERLGTVGIGNSMLGAAAMFLGALVLFTLTGGGAGDVKLVTALGALFGLNAGVDVVLYGFVAAGAGCLIWAVWRHGPLAIVRTFARTIGSLLLPLWVDVPTPEQGRLLRVPIPLAPFFALGTLLVLTGLTLSRYSEVLGW